MFALEGQIDIEDASFKAGLIDAHLSQIFPDEFRYYLSLEYNYNDFTPYVYYSSEKLSFKRDGAQSSLERDNMTDNITQKYSTGVRYDFYLNMALKFSYTHESKTIKYSGFARDVSYVNEFKAVFNVVF